MILNQSTEYFYFADVTIPRRPLAHQLISKKDIGTHRDTCLDYKDNTVLKPWYNWQKPTEVV